MIDLIQSARAYSKRSPLTPRASPRKAHRPPGRVTSCSRSAGACTRPAFASSGRSPSSCSCRSATPKSASDRRPNAPSCPTARRTNRARADSDSGRARSPSATLPRSDGCAPRARRRAENPGPRRCAPSCARHKQRRPGTTSMPSRLARVAICGPRSHCRDGIPPLTQSKCEGKKWKCSGHRLRKNHLFLGITKEIDS